MKLWMDRFIATPDQTFYLFLFIVVRSDLGRLSDSNDSLRRFETARCVGADVGKYV